MPPSVNATKGRELITIGPLASHTAGFPKPSPYEELRSTPGTTSSYSDGGLNWLADMLTEQNPEDLADGIEPAHVVGVGLRTPDDIRSRSIAAAGAPRTNPRPADPTLRYRELAYGIQANTNAMARVVSCSSVRAYGRTARSLRGVGVERSPAPLPENTNLQLNEPARLQLPGATSGYGVLWWTNSPIVWRTCPPMRVGHRASERR